MEIWIIRDGEKTGPFHDYEVRERISRGDLTAETFAWHEGLGAWRPLAQIPIFRSVFEKAAEPATASDAAEPAAGPPPLPQPPAYGRRFWARWCDLTLYLGLWWLGMWAARQDIAAAITNANPLIAFTRYIPWFAIEALLIHYFATTPGKWLLGLRVVNHDGSRLDLGAAVRRSLRVLFIGIGFGWGLLSVFCQALGFFTAKRLGAALWDHAGGHRVTVEPLNPFKLVGVVFAFVAAMMLQTIVVYPYMLDALSAQSPELKEMYEKNPVWHLPKRLKEHP